MRAVGHVGHEHAGAEATHSKYRKDAGMKCYTMVVWTSPFIA